MKSVLVIPTWNEQKNIGRLVEELQSQFLKVSHEMHILVVDDNSPDGTAETVKSLQSKYTNLHLIQGQKAGLGAAYIRGITYALNTLNAEVIFEMDADFQHKPQDVPRLLSAIDAGADFVIGSRYVEGGSIPEEWGMLRKLNSRYGNMVARYLAGLSEVHDCTAGFRAIRASLLKKIDLQQMKVQGYAFQVALLFEAIIHKAKITEVPVDFVERAEGESKLGVSDIIEFVVNAWWLRFRASATFIKFLIVGASGVLVNLGLFTLLLHFEVNKYLASPLAIEASILTNFALNNNWTFRWRETMDPVHIKGLKFNLISLLALGISYGTFILLSLLFPESPPQLIQLIGIIPATFINYFLNSYWTFSENDSNQSIEKVRNFVFGILDHKHFLLSIFTLFVLIRLSLIILLPLVMGSDAQWYLSRAEGIAAGLGYSEGGYPTAYWPVGYPGFLSVLFYLFGSNPLIGQLANLVLSTGILYLLLLLSRHFFGNERISRLSLLLLTIYPNNAAYTPLLLTEIYFTFLIMLGSYLLIVKRNGYWLLLSGLVFGLAVMTKPQVILLPGLLIALRFFQNDTFSFNKKIVVPAIIIYSVMACVLTPWAIRNTTTFGELVLISTNGGATLLTGNNPSAQGDFTPDDALVAGRNFSVKDQVAADKRAYHLAVQWIKDNPMRFITNMPLKAWRLWAPDGEAEWAYQAGYSKYDQNWYWFRLVRTLNQVCYVFFIACFLFSLLNFKKLKSSSCWPYTTFPLILAMYLTLISIVFSGQSRFHFPVMPWIIMIDAWVLFEILKDKEINAKLA